MFIIPLQPFLSLRFLLTSHVINFFGIKNDKSRKYTQEFWRSSSTEGN